MYEFLRTSTNEIVLEYNDKYEKLTHDELAPLCRQGDLIALYEMGSRCCLGLDGEEVDAPAARQFFEKILSMQRNARAVYLLGEMYRDGEFGKENERICRECYEYGYLWGDARSAEKLGVLYELGEFVEKDIDKAIGLYKEAIEKGNEHAYFSLGDLYINLENYYSARECLEKAIEADDYSYILLGNIYEDGLGVKQDHEKAREYYEKAYESGLTDAAHYLGRLYLLGNGVSEDIDKAREYFEEAVNGGMTSSNYGLGSIYIHYAEQGINVDDNLKRGIEALDKAPEDLHDRTYQMLGIAYKLLGDTERARGYFSEALALGNKAAEEQLRALEQKERGKRRVELLNTNIVELERLYEEGDEDTIFPIANSYHNGSNGAPVDPVKAYAYYSELCEKHLFGEQNAKYAMATLILDGKIENADKTEGIKILRELDEKGYATASVLLGEIYRRGLHGVARNFEKAVDCYEKAAANGNAISKCCLAEMYFMGQVDGKQDVPRGIELIKEVLQSDPNNNTARWYMASFELNGASDNGKMLVPQNEEHAISEMEDLARLGNINAINKLDELYSSKDSKYYDIDKAIRLAENALQLGFDLAPEHLFAFHVFDEYRPQTEESIKKGMEYGFQCLDMDNSNVPKEIIMGTMVDCLIKLGANTDYSKKGFQRLFDYLKHTDLTYSDEKNFNYLKEAITGIYHNLGYDANGNECFPRKDLHDMAARNSYVAKATEELRNTYIGQYPKPEKKETVQDETSVYPAQKNSKIGIAILVVFFVLVLFYLLSHVGVKRDNDGEKTAISDDVQNVAIEDIAEEHIAEDGVENSTAQQFAFLDGYGNKHEVNLNPSVPLNNYSESGFSFEDNRVYYEDDEYISRVGIDVSKYQGSIDWNAVKDDGIDFCFIRIGNRGYSEGVISLDQEFINNIEGAKNAGLDVGVYFFSQAISEQEAIEEADFVIENLSGYSLELPIVYNTGKISKEDSRTDNISNEQVALNAKAFCDRIDSRGYEAALYTDMLWEAYVFDLAQMSNYPIWYSDYYSNTPQTPYEFMFWQYSNKGKVAGVSTDVDLDLWIIRKDSTEVKGEEPATLSDEDICVMAKKYYYSLYNVEPQYVEIDSIDGDILLIHLYDVVIDDAETGEGHTATYDWYSINRNTLTGTNLLEEEIDLNGFK